MRSFPYKYELLRCHRWRLQFKSSHRAFSPCLQFQAPALFLRGDLHWGAEMSASGKFLSSLGRADLQRSGSQVGHTHLFVSESRGGCRSVSGFVIDFYGTRASRMTVVLLLWLSSALESPEGLGQEHERSATWVRETVAETASEAQAIKGGENKWNPIKMKIFGSVKETLERIKK